MPGPGGGSRGGGFGGGSRGGGADSVAAEATEEAVASIEVHASTEDTAMAHVLASVRVFTVVEDALAACLVC